MENYAALSPEAVSTLDQKKVLKPAFELGAVDFIIKPFNRGLLTQTLQRVTA